MDYLLKTEPTVYSFADLEREQSTIWDGVTNPVAVKHLREMKAGDRLVIYHTGDDKSAVGTASVVSVDASDPKIPQVKIREMRGQSPGFTRRVSRDATTAPAICISSIAAATIANFGWRAHRDATFSSRCWKKCASVTSLWSSDMSSCRSTFIC